jgi:hypothetical protein
MSSLGEIFRDKRTMVKRPAKAHLFFLNVVRQLNSRLSNTSLCALIHVEPINPLALWSQETGCVHDFLLATSRVAGFFGVLAIIVLSLSIGLTLRCQV